MEKVVSVIIILLSQHNMSLISNFYILLIKLIYQIDNHTGRNLPDHLLSQSVIPDHLSFLRPIKIKDFKAKLLKKNFSVRGPLSERPSGSLKKLEFF